MENKNDWFRIFMLILLIFIGFQLLATWSIFLIDILAE